VLGPQPDRHADQADAVRVGRDPDARGCQRQTLHRLPRQIRHRWQPRRLGEEALLRAECPSSLRAMEQVDRTVGRTVVTPCRVSSGRLRTRWSHIAVERVTPPAPYRVVAWKLTILFMHTSTGAVARAIPTRTTAGVP